MSTKVYGCSDDLIEIEGDVSGEYGCYGTDDDKHGVMIICSDGTLLEVKYGKADLAIWEVKCLSGGPLLDRIDVCDDEMAKVHSDVAHFRDGLRWAYAARDWARVQ